jgi:hypothetical protein
MKRLRKYVRKKLRDTFQNTVEEETSSSDKQNDVKSSGSLWDAAFTQKTPRDPMEVEKSMWDVEFGAGTTTTTPEPKK